MLVQVRVRIPLPAGFKTSQRSAKMVKYWLSYGQNSELDCFGHNSANSWPFWLYHGSFWRVNPSGHGQGPLRVRVRVQREIPVGYPCTSLLIIAAVAVILNACCFVFSHWIRDGLMWVSLFLPLICIITSLCVVQKYLPLTHFYLSDTLYTTTSLQSCTLSFKGNLNCLSCLDNMAP